MRRWLLVLFFAGVMVFPVSVRAQNPITMASLEVQLWPEYDQPSMLIIYDFKLPAAVKLPVNVSIAFPKDANLVAVASQAADGNLLTSDYAGPVVNDNSQTITVQIQKQSTYHLEYYEPLSKTGKQREYKYVWTGDYTVDAFSISVRVPVDTTVMTTVPILKSSKGSDGTSYLTKDVGRLDAGLSYTLQVNYTKTSDKLSASQTTVQPSQPLSSSTPGRVMLSNYLPYILGMLGVVLIIGGSVYFWQSSRGRGLRSGTARKRHRVVEPIAAKNEIYCHLCGARAEPGDHFCRVCGTRLRLGE